jgi:hypothetical protein
MRRRFGAAALLGILALVLAATASSHGKASRVKVEASGLVGINTSACPDFVTALPGDPTSSFYRSMFLDAEWDYSYIPTASDPDGFPFLDVKTHFRGTAEDATTGATYKAHAHFEEEPELGRTFQILARGTFTLKRDDGASISGEVNFAIKGIATPAIEWTSEPVCKEGHRKHGHH